MRVTRRETKLEHQVLQKFCAAPKIKS